MLAACLWRAVRFGPKNEKRRTPRKGVSLRVRAAFAFVSEAQGRASGRYCFGSINHFNRRVYWKQSFPARDWKRPSVTLSLPCSISSESRSNSLARGAKSSSARACQSSPASPFAISCAPKCNAANVWFRHCAESSAFFWARQIFARSRSLAQHRAALTIKPALHSAH